MGRILNEEEIKTAEFAISHCFDVAGVKRLQARAVIQQVKAFGLHRAEIKEARKRLGVASRNEDGLYWWIWEDATSPGEINQRLSEEFWRKCDAGKGNREGSRERS